jgi:hypothetical protein
MKTEDFIYKNIAKLLADKNKDAKQGVIAMAAKHGKNHFLNHGNFNKKAFDVCYKEAEKELKKLIKAKL